MNPNEKLVNEVKHAREIGYIDAPGTCNCYSISVVPDIAWASFAYWKMREAYEAGLYKGAEYQEWSEGEWEIEFEEWMKNR